MWHIKYKMSVGHSSRYLYTWVWSSEKRISLEVPIWNHQHIRGHLKSTRLMRLPRERIYTAQRKALRSEPWGIPTPSCQGDDGEESRNSKGAETGKERPERYKENQESAVS